jgi:GNAT superfamily N-acetyltransferase
LSCVHAEDRYPINWPEDPTSWLDPSELAGAWVAAVDREVVGHVCLTHRPNLAPAMSVERFFVSPAFRHRGVGRALLTHTTQWAELHGLPLTLEVVDGRGEAISFYKRMGWRETGRTAIDWGGDVASQVIRFDAP